MAESGQWPEGRQRSKQVKAEAEVKVRIALTEFVQHAVEGLGRQVSGDLLNGSPPPHHHHEQRT
jgi:hypothetical protein